MNCLFISSDDRLKTEIKKEFPEFEHIDTFVSIDDMSEFKNGYDVVIVSDHIVGYQDLNKLKDIKRKHAFYMIHNYGSPEVIENMKLLANKQGFVGIPPKRATMQIVFQIRSIIFGEANNDKKVIAFLGSHRDIGLSQTVHCIADQLAGKIEGKILVLNTSAFSDGSELVEYKGSYFDELYPYLHMNAIGANDLISKFHEDEKYLFMAGNRDMNVRYRYSSDSINNLISMAKEKFDLILIDAGAELDNNMTLQAVQQADFKIMVTTQQAKGVRSIGMMFKYILGHLDIKPTDFMLVVNKHDIEYANDDTDISRKTGIPFLSKLEDVKELGIMAENEGRIITRASGAKKSPLFKRFTRDLDDLTDSIIMRYSLKRKQDKQKSGFFEMFKGGKA